MKSTTVSANLFRIAATFVSTEETRYYLRGVFVTPHQNEGVLLVATDGKRLFVAHDETGHTDFSEGVIVTLDKPTLAACKPAKSDTAPRLLDIDETGLAKVCANNDGNAHKPVALHADSFVDGTFPDWRRIAAPNLDEPAPATINGGFLIDFAKAAVDLTGNRDAGLRIVSVTEGPCLVRFDGVDHAYGILMPLRAKDSSCKVPFFLNAPSAEDIAASKAKHQVAAE